MSEQLLTILKLCLLALLYLFFFRVVRAVWAELRSAGATTGGAVAAPARPAAAPPAAAAPKRRARGVPTELVATDPPERRGALVRSHALGPTQKSTKRAIAQSLSPSAA